MALALGGCTAVVLCLRRKQTLPQPGLLLAAAACAVLGICLPDAFGGGGYIRSRFLFPAIVFGVAVMASTARLWPRFVRAAVFFLLLLACLLSWGLRLPKIAEYNSLLADCARITSRIPAGATVLPIGPPSPAWHVDPLIQPCLTAASAAP